MPTVRRPLAQALLVAVAGSVFLTWVSTPSGESTVGIDFSEGRLTAIIAVITIGVIQLGLRPAWIGNGLIVAVLGRELGRTSGSSGLDPGAGLWLGLVLAVASLGLLIWDLFSSIDRSPIDSDGD